MKQTEKIIEVIKEVLKDEEKYFELSSKEKCEIFNMGSKVDKYEYNYKDMSSYLKDVIGIK